MSTLFIVLKKWLTLRGASDHIGHKSFLGLHGQRQRKGPPPAKAAGAPPCPAAAAAERALGIPLLLCVLPLYERRGWAGRWRWVGMRTQYSLEGAG
eukprot:1143400-Pelagomonas_calceolata.AAC.12